MGKLVDDLIGKTEEYLQPNPGKTRKKTHYEIQSLIPLPFLIYCWHKDLTKS